MRGAAPRRWDASWLVDHQWVQESLPSSKPSPTSWLFSIGSWLPILCLAEPAACSLVTSWWYCGRPSCSARAATNAPHERQRYASCSPSYVETRSHFLSWHGRPQRGIMLPFQIQTPEVLHLLVVRWDRLAATIGLQHTPQGTRHGESTCSCHAGLQLELFLDSVVLSFLPFFEFWFINDKDNVSLP